MSTQRLTDSLADQRLKHVSNIFPEELQYRMLLTRMLKARVKGVGFKLRHEIFILANRRFLLSRDTSPWKKQSIFKSLEMSLKVVQVSTVVSVNWMTSKSVWTAPVVSSLDTVFLQKGSSQWQKPANSVTEAGLAGLGMIKGLYFGQSRIAGENSHLKKKNVPWQEL